MTSHGSLVSRRFQSQPVYKEAPPSAPGVGWVPGTQVTGDEAWSSLSRPHLLDPWEEVSLEGRVRLGFLCGRGTASVLFFISQERKLRPTETAPDS